ncbi:MAG: hypothetical protein ACR2L9_05155 [Solirubrobacteraceae bacterium]
MPSLSHETRHALKVIRDYLAGQNEAVQYCLQFMADLVSETSSGIMGGIQAGAVPANDIVSDTNAEVFELNSSPSGATPGSLSLNLDNGELTASWTVNGTTINVSGEVRCVEEMAAPPTDRFLFVIKQATSGFYVFTTTNI